MAVALPIGAQQVVTLPAGNSSPGTSVVTLPAGDPRPQASVLPSAGTVDSKLHANVLKLMELTGERERMQKAFPKLLSDGKAKMLQEFPVISPAFGNEWEKRMAARINVDDFLDVEARVYEKHFTNDEILELITVMNATKEGKLVKASAQLQQRFLAELPAILGEIAGRDTELAVRLSVQLGSEIGREHPEYIRPGAALPKSDVNPTVDPRLKATPQKDFRPNPKAALYLLPLGLEAAEDAIGLARDLQDVLGLTAEPLPAVNLDTRYWNEQRLQWNAGGLLRQIAADQAKIGVRPNAVVIGVTASDLYIPGVSWQFAFAYRATGPFGVVSSARLSLPTPEHPTTTEELRLSRLRKVLVRQVGLLYYGLPLNRDPHSVLHQDLLGVDELDTMELRY